MAVNLGQLDLDSGKMASKIPIKDYIPITKTKSAPLAP